MDAWETLQAIAPTVSGDAWELFNNASTGGSITITGDGMELQIDIEDFNVALLDEGMSVEISEEDYEVDINMIDLEVPIL